MRVFCAGLGVLAVGLTCFQLGRICFQPASVQAQDDAAKPEFYTTRVKPIFDQNCGRCHEGMNRRGGLSLDTRAAMLKGGHDGTVLVPGDPQKSLIVRLIRHEGPADDPMPMPPKRPKLSDADIAVVERWVKAGAVMP
jgi:mono/diheme cytochrome c family protein